MPRRKKTHEEFVEEVFNLVENEYTVLSEYSGVYQKIVIRHERCGNEYNVAPSKFLNDGNRCHKCTSANRRKSNEQMEKEILTSTNGEYCIVSKYINAKNKVHARHNRCGNVWLAYARDIVSGKTSCPECALKSRVVKLTKPNEQFIEEVVEAVGLEYTFLDKYIGAFQKIKVRHNVCNNVFSVSPKNFLSSGTRCHYCNMSSSGERSIGEFLDSLKINYKPQYRFDDCKYKNTLPFDFSILDDNGKVLLLIEYDGEQHFKPVSIFGGEIGYEKIIANDSIKNDYCEKNAIDLLRIPYWDVDNLEEILSKRLTELNILQEVEANV